MCVNRSNKFCKNPAMCPESRLQKYKPAPRLPRINPPRYFDKKQNFIEFSTKQKLISQFILGLIYFYLRYSFNNLNKKFIIF